MKSIVIKGAREHNLKNLDLELPREKFIVLTGLSGSGKSTLAFDTLYAEGQRRYVESLSAYARQFLGLMNKPDVESITGLSPAISIEQKTTSRNPRSTVGTVTEIYDHLRLLFARAGKPHCPDHGAPIEASSPARIAGRIGEAFAGQVTVLAPVVRKKKGHHQRILEKLNREGIIRARVNGKIVRTDETVELPRYEMHTVEAVIDRLDAGRTPRLAEAVERAARMSDGLVVCLGADGTERAWSTKMACPECGLAFEELQPRMFSFNSPFGACETCSGLGVRMEFDEALLIPDRDRSIATGALAVYRNAVDGWRGQYLGGLCEHYGFTVETPIRDLTKRQYDALMHGSAETIKFELVMKGGDANWSHKGEWEGLLPQCERLYRQTESEYRRTELEKFMRVSPCPSCAGRRLKKKVLSVLVQGRSIADVTGMSVGECAAFFRDLALPPREAQVARVILKEIRERLLFLEKVGLSYLALDRAAGTLSGGEAQRIRLATQIGTNLTGVLYILDEPSIGLHPRDNERLIETLHRLRDLGNTLVVVEHDEATIRAADHVVDLGPGAGIHGGEIVAQGTPRHIERSSSLTGRYLRGALSIDPPEVRVAPRDFLAVRGCRAHNLKNLDVRIPLGALACVTGVSGSGKSTLVHDILYKGLAARLHGAKERPGDHDGIDADGRVDAVHVIDQSPIGRTPRSNPATYTKVFDEIRRVFAGTKEARVRGYEAGRFSFNLKGGRCEACEGDGLLKIEMNFLPDVYVECEECKGRRYNAETLEVTFRDRSIADVLAMSVEEALELFANIPAVRRKLETLAKVGLSYIKLGQSSTTLSGGEAQRIKLTRELSKSSHGRTLYLLDEPTTGLHFHDVKQLLGLLRGLVERGASVVVIEHNVDVIASADWVIDLGPEGGDAGGRVVAEGTPEEVARVAGSHTGRFLAERLGAAKRQKPNPTSSNESARSRPRRSASPVSRAKSGA